MLDYFGIEQAVKDRLNDTDELADVSVKLEQELSFGERGRQVYIALQRRSAPEGLQSISAGSRTRFLLQISLWCFCWDLSLEEAAHKRDHLISQVEVALMREPRSFGVNNVTSSWIQGGEFSSGEEEASFMSGGEIVLVVDATNII